MNFHIVVYSLFITFFSVHGANFFKCMNWFVYNIVDLKVSFNCASLEGHIVHSKYFDESNEIDWKYSCVLSRGYNDEINISYTEAREIYFESCRFTHMPGVFFHRFGQLRKIQMDDSSIEVINNEAFPKNCSLERLTMSLNELTELPPFLFSNTLNISEVNFSHNQISNIHPNTFRGQNTQFRVINLSHNHIETLDKLLLIDLLNLEELDLGYNYMEEFQVDLSKLKNLSVLRLNNNKIIQLHCENVLNLAAVTINIDVSMNNLQEIDLNCSVNLKSLSLNINDNYLENLTFPVSKLVNSLEQITASGNKIATITTESNKNNVRKVSYPRNLILLDLSHNNLTKIDFEVFSPFFIHLRNFSLNDNHLTDLIGWTETDFLKLKYFNILNNGLNCSYLEQFLKLVPKRISLTRDNTSSLRSNKRKNISKNIHGIECIEDNNISATRVGDTGNQVNILEKRLDAMVYYLIFLTFLTVICIVVKVIECYKGNAFRWEANERTVIYQSNDIV